MINKLISIFFEKNEQRKKTVIRKENCLKNDSFTLINKKVRFKTFEEREQYYKLTLISENQI